MFLHFQITAAVKQSLKGQFNKKLFMDIDCSSNGYGCAIFNQSLSMFHYHNISNYLKIVSLNHINHYACIYGFSEETEFKFDFKHNRVLMHWMRIS